MTYRSKVCSCRTIRPSNHTDNYTCNYAITYLFPDETKANIQLKTGSLGHTTIWLNDEKIKEITHNELKLDDNNINIQLRYGQNKLLIKSCGINSSKHGFFTRLTNFDEVRGFKK